MENELYQYLTTLSNKQLVKITEEPEDYTPEAIQAIKQILLSRKITHEEEETIRRELMVDIFEEHRQKELFEERWKPVIAFYNLVKKPSLIKQDNYLLFFLLIILSLYYLVFLYDRLNFLYYEITHFTQGGFFFGAVNFIHLVSTPFVITLLYKKQSLGWVLSTFGKTIELTRTVSFQLYYIQQFSYLGSFTKLKLFLYILLLTGILVCLNYKQTRSILGISRSTQKQTIIAGIVTGIIYFFIVEKIYY